MKQFNCTYLMIGLCLLFLVNCKVDETKQEDLGFFSISEIKEYTYFKVGTYWVYKNNKSSELDSIVVTYSRLDTASKEGPQRKFRYEYFESEYYSHTTKTTYRLYEMVNDPSGAYWRWFYMINKEHHYFNKPTKEHYAFFYPFDSTIYTTSDPNIDFKNNFDSINLVGNKFFMCKEFNTHDDNTFSPDSYSSSLNYVYAKNIGLIQIRNDKNGESWDLIRYKVIQN